MLSSISAYLKQIYAESGDFGSRMEAILYSIRNDSYKKCFYIHMSVIDAMVSSFFTLEICNFNVCDVD